MHVAENAQVGRTEGGGGWWLRASEGGKSQAERPLWVGRVGAAACGPESYCYYNYYDYYHYHCYYHCHYYK